MKNKIILFLSLIGIMVFSSCEDDEIIKITKNPVAPEMVSPTTGGTLSYTKDDAGNSIKFILSPADYGFQASVNYEIQVDKENNDFKDAATIVAGYKDTLTTTVGDLNGKLLSLKFREDVEATMEMRVIAIVNSDVDTLISKSIKVKVTPYLVIINYPDLQVPGAYQGWDPSKADSIESLNFDDNYEGYIYMTSGGFKFTQGGSWDKNWGDTGGDGTLEEGGADLSITEDGVYKLNVNLKKLTYTKLKTDWGLIGSATPGGWDSDTDMTYNQTEDVWSLTLDLVAGDIKFRANDEWDLAYGDVDDDGKLDQENDNNIAVSDAGNYTVTLNLSKLPYTYSLEKN